jgi:hypothetical protein
MERYREQARKAPELGLDQMISAHVDDDLPEILALLHMTESVWRFLERKDGIHHGL